MPALAKVRAIAKAVVCQSNLKQFGLAFEMYTQSNNGYYCVGYGGAPGPGGSPWINTLRPYYKNEKLPYCPSAEKPRLIEEAGGYYAFGSKFESWGSPVDPTAKYCLGGSYGLNEWISNAPDAILQPFWKPPIAWWRTTNMRNASKIPVLLDSAWSAGYCMDNAPPPIYEGDTSGIHYFKWHCINRHSGYINGLFMDSTVRKVGLKELWTFEWHRGFNTQNEWTIAFYGSGANARKACADYWDSGWEWMKDFKEY